MYNRHSIENDVSDSVCYCVVVPLHATHKGTRYDVYTLYVRYYARRLVIVPPRGVDLTVFIHNNNLGV